MILPHLKEGDLQKIERGLTGSWESLKDLKVSSLGDIYSDSWKLNRAIDAIFKEYDLIITPCMPIPPFGAKGPMPVEEFSFPLHAVGFLTPFNFSGHPACVIRFKDNPMHQGAPLGGIQIIGERFQDALVLEMAHRYEKAITAFTWPDVLGTSESRL